MKISGCLIVRNEEKNISECLGSLGKIADEIITVDTGSEDNTVNIALESGAKVFHYQWNNDFSAAKNFALDHATGDWVIFLDADEYFDEVSLAKIGSCIAKADETMSTEGILCKIVNIDIDTNNIISNNQTLRIFRNGEKCRFINKIHEEIRHNGRPLRYIDASDQITLYHTGYSSSLQKAKAERNLELLLGNMEDEKTPYYLATTYYILKYYENALKYADIALSRQIITDDESMDYKMYVIKIAVKLMDNNIHESVMELLINEANTKCGKHPEIAKVEAAYYLSRKHYSKALEKFRGSIKLNTEYGSMFRQNDFPGMIDGVYFYMGRILDLMNNKEDALSNYVDALKFNKYNAEAFDQLLALFSPVKDEEVIYFLNSIYKVNNENDVKFVVSRINRTGRSGIILYYANIWNKVFKKEDDILIFAFLALKEYDKALEIALLYLRDDKNDYSFAVLVAAIVILGKLYDDIENNKDILPVEILKLIYYNAGVALSGSSLINTNSFIAVFSELVNNADGPVIEEYLKLSGTLDDYTQFRIADVFLINCKYEQAIQYYSKYFNLVHSQELKADAAFKAGYCYYKQRKFAESLEWFEKAIKAGYRQIDVKEYLTWVYDLSEDHFIRNQANEMLKVFMEMSTAKISRLNIGCGRDIKDGWINLDSMELPGVDVIADLDNCRNVRLPFDDDFADEILASHVIEHIKEPLAMMEELHRISKPNAKAVFKCPYGTSDDAFEDPTHVKQYFMNSFGYFSQPFYWRADYGYRGDWCVETITLVVDRKKYFNKNQVEIMEDILTYRNIVMELIVELRAIKPIREQKKELIIEPKIDVHYA